MVNILSLCVMKFAIFKKSRNHFYFNNGIAALSQSICIGLELEQAESIPRSLAKPAQELLEEHKRF